MSFVLEENEKWVNGYEGMYSVDTTGQVYSYKRGSKLKHIGGVIYDKSRGRHSYRVGCFFKEGKSKSLYFHRLVAEAFIPNPDNKKEVNHIDGDKLNNSVENLEWATRSENTIHAFATGLMEGRAVSEEDWKARADIFIMTSDASGLLPEYISGNITKDDLHRNHIPIEFLNISKSHKTQHSPLDVWNHYIDLFRLCDSELSLSQVAKIVGMDHSMISYLRSGKRGKRARKVYDKYKDDPYYFVNYKPVYKYYI
jgi:hypothetical protein